jgi:DNA-binding CsgD family transcriptional regulator
MSRRMDKKLSVSPAPSLLLGMLLRVFNAMNCGGIFLDADKRVVHMSGRAKTALEGCLSIKNGRLCAHDRTSDVLFQTMMDQHLKYGESHKQWRRQALGLKREDRRPLIVRTVVIEPTVRREMDDAALVLMLVDPEDCPEPSDAILQQVFGTTKAEARIANRLLCGESLQEIAEATGVSIGTVRSQMKALFVKTGTHRQAELVALLTRLAMISEDE